MLKKLRDYAATLIILVILLAGCATEAPVPDAGVFVDPVCGPQPSEPTGVSVAYQGDNVSMPAASYNAWVRYHADVRAYFECKP